MIRCYHPNDFNEVAQIHEKYYAEEFSLPNFFDRFLCSFTIVEDGEIISAGGVRAIAESVIVTDKSKNIKVRRKALYDMLDAQMFVTKKYGYDQLHASIINDPQWQRHLIKVGFKPIKGNMLVLEV